jgi:hypothetical protein
MNKGLRKAMRALEGSFLFDDNLERSVAYRSSRGLDVTFGKNHQQFSVTRIGDGFSSHALRCRPTKKAVGSWQVSGRVCPAHYRACGQTCDSVPT